MDQLITSVACVAYVAFVFVVAAGLLGHVKHAPGPDPVRTSVVWLIRKARK